MVYTYDYYFVENGRTRVHSEAKNEIWLDVGGEIGVGAFDHHQCTNEYNSTVDVIVRNWDLLKQTKERIKKDEVVRFYLHQNPDIDTLFAVYYLKFYLENEEKIFKEMFLEGTVADKLLQYVNDIDTGKNKVVSKATLYCLVSHLDRQHIKKWAQMTTEEYSNVMLDKALNWVQITIDRVKNDLKYDLYNNQLDALETDEEAKIIIDIIKSFKANYEQDKIDGRLVIKEIPIWTTLGTIENVKAAIWKDYPLSPSSSYILAREEGAVVTFVPHNEYGDNGARVSINPDIEGAVGKYSLNEVGEMYEQVEQIYEHRIFKETGLLRRDYSRPRTSGQNSIFHTKPFSRTADPWYVSGEMDMVDAPGKGSLISYSEMIEILENITKQVKSTHIVSFDFEKKKDIKGTQVDFGENTKKSFISWTKEMRKIVSSIKQNQYKLIIVEVDASIIAHSYDVLDAYFMNLSAGAYIDEEDKTVLRVDYRTHLYLNQHFAVLFVATADECRTAIQMKGLLDWEKKETLEACGIVDIFSKILSQREQFKEIGRFLGEFKGNPKKVQKKNEELIRLLADSQADECLDSQIEIDVFKFIYEALDVRTLRQSVKETMDMVSVYSKERTYANLNFLSLISVPFILVTTVVQMGIIKLKPIWDFEKVASNKVTWMSWIFVLGVTILLTGIFFGTRRKR